MSLRELCIYILLTMQARGQDGLILGKFSFCIFIELAWSIKDLLYGITLKKLFSYLSIFEHRKETQLFAKVMARFGFLVFQFHPDR